MTSLPRCRETNQAPQLVRAHDAGLQVHGWTARKDNAFLPTALRSSENDADIGHMPALIALLNGAGVDGVFTDDTGLASTVLPQDGLENMLRAISTADDDR